MGSARAVDAAIHRYYAEFFYRTAHGGKDPEVPFATIGNAGIGLNFVDILRELGHDVNIIEVDEEDE